VGLSSCICINSVHGDGCADWNNGEQRSHCWVKAHELLEAAAGTMGAARRCTQH
jgi:hypothetical protein